MGSPFSYLLWLRARWKQQGSIFANWGKAANKEQVKERKREKRIWKKNRIKEGRGSLEGGRRQGTGPTLAGGGADPAPPRNLPKGPWKFQARQHAAPRSPCCALRLLPRTLPKASAQPSPHQHPGLGRPASPSCGQIAARWRQPAAVSPPLGGHPPIRPRACLRSGARCRGRPRPQPP